MIRQNHNQLNWPLVKLVDVITEAQPGFASGERDPNGVIQLRMNNVDRRGNLVWNEFIRVPASAAMIEKFCLKDGDIVFNNTNSTELVGKSAIFQEHREPVVYSNHFTRLRTNPTELIPAYLANWLVYQWQTHVFERLCNRWIGQSAVKNDVLLALEIPLPPLEEQQRIVVFLNERLSTIDRVRASAEAQLSLINSLPGAILHRVFNGEI